MANIRIADSYLISKKDFKEVLNNIKRSNPSNPVFQNRKIFSLKMEWATHNFLHSLGLFKDRTKDVDLDYPCDKPEWLYIIIGILVWLFIK